MADFITGMGIGMICMLIIAFVVGKYLIDANEKLEDRVKVRDNQIADLAGELQSSAKMIQELTYFKDPTPDDCKPGPYCVSCQFVKYFVAKGYNGDYEKRRYCGKIESCKNYISKYEAEVKKYERIHSDR